MNEEARFMKVTREVMTDEALLQVNISIKEAWLLTSALQLATRHPGVKGKMKKSIVDIAKQFEQAIIDLHPEAAEPLALGWDPNRDR